MRVAVIGRPGSGRTNLADLVSRELGVPVVSTIEEIRAKTGSADSFVADGVPADAAELRQLTAQSEPALLDHVLVLVTQPADLGPELAEIRDLLTGDPRLVEIDASGSPYKTMVLAFEALKIRI